MKQSVPQRRSNTGIDSLDYLSRADRRLKIRMYAVSGGAETTQDVWSSIGQVWPGAMSCVNPLVDSVRAGLGLVDQLSALLLMPMMLSQSSPGNTVIAGWSLGCNSSQVIAMWLSTCVDVVRAACVLEARNRRPLLFDVVSLGRSWLARQREMDESHTLNGRRIPFGAAHTSPFGLSYCTTTEFQSSLLRGLDRNFYLQEDWELLERSELYAGAADFAYFPDSDHDLLGKQNPWDIARRVRSFLRSP